MAPALVWDQPGEKEFETGVDKGVLYPVSDTGTYPEGHAWNGLVSVTESPSGAESNKQYANNKVYLNLISAEEFSATIEAFTYPDAFAECDGSAQPKRGVHVGQQRRRGFGLAWRSLIGNDTLGTDYGYKIKLGYGLQASPTEKANTTINDSPEASTFSWECSSTPIDAGPDLKPTAIITINSTDVDPAELKALEDILYGTAALPARLPLPVEVFELFTDEVPAGARVASFEQTGEATIGDTQTSVEDFDGETVTQ
jgi:hypothetical protein